MLIRALAIVASFLIMPCSAWSLCVTASQANLRAKPSASSQLLWTVGKYMPLLELDYKAGWYLVKDFEGKKMWIAAQLVSDDIDCAVVRVSKSLLYNGPSKRFDQTPLSYAFKYAPFKKLAREEAWLQLQDDYGFKHWVHEKSLWEPLEYTQLSY